MLAWDVAWKNQAARVDSLTARSRRQLAAQCIRRSLSRLTESLCAQYCSDVDRLVRGALESIECGVPIDRQLKAEIARNLTIVSEPGAYDLLMAVLTLDDAGTDLDASSTLESLSYSYQSTLDIEILSVLDHEMTETEVRERESANATCMESISEQLSILGEIEAGDMLNEARY